MPGISRRRFVRQVGIAASVAGAAASDPAVGAQKGPAIDYDIGCETIPLDGKWGFRLDPEKAGEAQTWYKADFEAPGWSEVTVPHTWQTAKDTSDYLGAAWYRRRFEAPRSWNSKALRVEFEAVYHSAVVWLNGVKVGEHLRKGYTAFTCDLSPALRFGADNLLVVRVDNTFDTRMLPRDNSFDWTTDGGITRPVSLLVTPKTFIEWIGIDTEPDPEKASAVIDVRCSIRNTGARTARVSVGARVSEEDTGRTVAEQIQATSLTLGPGETRELSLPQLRVAPVHLWHFDHPNLYRMHVELLVEGKPLYGYSTSFGVRKIEARGTGFYLNGERVWLMGVERMAGSHPDYGMAEPLSWIEHDHRDMKELNCVFTRVHWQQDRRVLDYCDRQGILIQVEVPSWGGATFKGMTGEPAPEIMQNGLEQLREMVRRDRNHPSVVAWGLCNEIGGQNPPAYQFAKRLYEEARNLDPQRLRSYASNSLQNTPGRDVAGLMDFIEWNEYYESWYGGNVASVRRNLEEIQRAFPQKPIVISEYGYCECDPKHTGGDERRIEVLRTHTDVYREFESVGGVIFFCYNDYRTHMGDKGLGVLKQRVHGVVDLYGERKPSFASLRQESSPLEGMAVKGREDGFVVSVQTRRRLPAYRLAGYALRWIVYGSGGIPLEQGVQPLSTLAPGEQAAVHFKPKEKNPRRLRIDLLRPTGRTGATLHWTPPHAGR